MKLLEIKVILPKTKPRNPNQEVLAAKKNAGGAMKKPREGVHRDEKHKKPPEAEVQEAKIKKPLIKIRMPQKWDSRLENAIKKMGYSITGSGYEDGSTMWAVVIDTPSKFNIKKFEDNLRDELNYGGYLEVKPSDYDIIEAVAGPFEKFSKDERVKVKKTGEEVTVVSQNDIGLVFTKADDAKAHFYKGSAQSKGYKEYMPRELERMK